MLHWSNVFIPALLFHALISHMAVREFGSVFTFEKLHLLMVAAYDLLKSWNFALWCLDVSHCSLECSQELNDENFMFSFSHFGLRTKYPVQMLTQLYILFKGFTFCVPTFGSNIGNNISEKIASYDMISKSVAFRLPNRLFKLNEKLVECGKFRHPSLVLF